MDKAKRPYPPPSSFLLSTSILYQMPAIDLARLKTQAARLSDQYAKPEAFVRNLNELLDYYTNRTIRSSQVARRLSLPTYRTPKPVLRQIERELEPLAEDHAVEAIALVNAMWKSGSLESRLLAAGLLGMLPPAQAMPALTRLPERLRESSDEAVRKALLTESLARLRRDNPEALFALLEDWLKSPRSVLQVWGLQALIPLLNQPEFENLPAVFRIVRPALELAGPATQLEMQACLTALARVSLTETLFFLREVLGGKPPAMLLRTLRRMLPALSEDLAAGLREMLRESGAT
jgi:hypothetical protein